MLAAYGVAFFGPVKPTLPADSPLRPLVAAVQDFDRGKLTGEQLCDAFGTPGRWWVLGPVDNPHTDRRYGAMEALSQPINPYTAYHGHSGVVRWFAYPNLDPRGVVSENYLFDWHNTDNSAAHLVSFVDAPRTCQAYLHLGWDDGIVVRLKDRVVFDQADYPPRGKGMLFRDKHQFETRVPITLEEGRSQLAVLSINSHGNWVFSLRITDGDNLPIPGLRFRLE